MIGRGAITRPARRLITKLRVISVVATGLFCIGCGSEAEVVDHPGKAVYQKYCYACHQAGIADAPKLGDKEAWAPRLTKTRAELVHNVIEGMAPGMPPRAGCGTCTDDELAAAVDFMVLRVE